MKTLVISKPIYNNVLPLQDFPSNKDVFNLNTSISDIMGEANVAAYILGKYNLPVSYTGIVGKDEAGDNFKNILASKNVDIKYVETDYELKTDVTYTILNTEKGGYSHIKVNTMIHDLTKFKYDFMPSYIVFDDKDFSGVNAALNNYPNVPAIFYGKSPNKDAINMCKRADYIVCNINFASKLTGLEIQLNKPKTIVNLYQKLIDLFKGVWIITLGEYGVIYSNQDSVKMIPALKTNVVDKDKASGVFFGTFAYAIVSGMDIENAVRLANINASNSLSQIGSTKGILNLEDLLKHRIISEVPKNINNQNISNVQTNYVSHGNIQQVEQVQVNTNNVAQVQTEQIQHSEPVINNNREQVQNNQQPVNQVVDTLDILDGENNQANVQ